MGGDSSKPDLQNEEFEEWLIEIKTSLEAFEKETGKKAAPYGVNLIVHPTNPRLEADIKLCVKHRVPLIITSLGAVSQVVDAIHSYGGLVFHDVIKKRHAKCRKYARKRRSGASPFCHNQA